MHTNTRLPRTRRILTAAVALISAAAGLTISAAQPAAAQALAQPMVANHTNNWVGFWSPSATEHGTCFAYSYVPIRGDLGQQWQSAVRSLTATFVFERNPNGSGPAWNPSIYGEGTVSGDTISFSGRAARLPHVAFPFAGSQAPGIDGVRGMESYGIYGQYWMYRALVPTPPSSNKRYMLRHHRWQLVDGAGNVHPWYTIYNRASQVGTGIFDPARQFTANAGTTPFVQDNTAPATYRDGAPASVLAAVTGINSNTVHSGTFPATVTRNVSAGEARTFTNHRYWRVESYGRDSRCQGSDASEFGDTQPGVAAKDGVGYDQLATRRAASKERYCPGGQSRATVCKQQYDALRAGDDLQGPQTDWQVAWRLQRRLNFGSTWTTGDGWTQLGAAPRYWTWPNRPVRAFHRVAGGGASPSSWTEATAAAWQDSPNASTPTWLRREHGSWRHRGWVDIERDGSQGARRIERQWSDLTYAAGASHRNTSGVDHAVTYFWDTLGPQLRDLGTNPIGEPVYIGVNAVGDPFTSRVFQLAAQSRDQNMPGGGAGVAGAIVEYQSATGEWLVAGEMSSTLTGDQYLDTRNHSFQIEFPSMDGGTIWVVRVTPYDRLGNLGTPQMQAVVVPDGGMRPVARMDTATVKVGDTVRVDVLANDENPNLSRPWFCPEFAHHGICDPLDGGSIQITRAPVEGEVRLVQIGSGPGDWRVEYEPYPWASGRDYFEYTVSIPGGRVSEPAGVRISIGDSSPDAADDSTSMTDGDVQGDAPRARIDVLANDADPDGDLDETTLEVLDTTQGITADVVLHNGRPHVRVTSVPPGVRSGELTYRVCDARGRAWVTAGNPEGFIGAPSVNSETGWTSGPNSAGSYCSTATVHIVFRLLSPT